MKNSFGDKLNRLIQETYYDGKYDSTFKPGIVENIKSLILSEVLAALPEKKQFRHGVNSVSEGDACLECTAIGTFNTTIDQTEARLRSIFGGNDE